MATLVNFAITAVLCIGFYKMGAGEASALSSVWLGVFVAWQIIVDVVAGER